jgi:hypothetical protein
MEQYNRKILETLPVDKLKLTLTKLEVYLTKRLSGIAEWDNYWDESKKIISELKKEGYNLCSHDYDGESKSLWGWDYMNDADTSMLQVKFDFNGSVRVFWKIINPQLGCFEESE